MTGKLVYADVHGATCASVLDSTTRLTTIVNRACEEGGATVMVTYAQRFHPQGVTVVSVLAESHAAVHTYPEVGGYMVDVFTCGDRADPLKIAASIMSALGGFGVVRQVVRGNNGTTYKTEPGAA